MILLRKPNRLSVLKNQPREFQQEVIDFLDGTAATPRHSLKETVEWLKTKGLETSLSSLCDFRRWWEDAHQRAILATTYLERVSQRVSDPGLSPDQILKIGQAFFEECAVNDRDAKLFTKMFRLRQHERAQELRQLSLRIRHDVAQHRAEIQERLLACRERMTNLAIWKASSKPTDQTETPNTIHPPSHNQSRGASSIRGGTAASHNCGMPTHPVSGKAAEADRSHSTAGDFLGKNRPGLDTAFAPVNKLAPSGKVAMAA